MKRIFFLISILIAMTGCSSKNESGYIPRPQVNVEDGKMTPEILLSLGRLSEPQISPDGEKLLYGVSYTSISGNRSCRNLFLCNRDGSGRIQLTRYAKSVSNACWSKDGKRIFFLQDAQIWEAPFLGNRLGKKKKISDVPAGISGFIFSPDETNVIYISSTNGPVKGPEDIDPSLDKAQAYIAENLMYRHWDHWVTETPRSFVSTTVNGTINEAGSFDILGGEDGSIELPTEPFGGTEQLCWRPDSRHIAYSCRKLSGKEYAFSTNTDIFIYDIVSGCTTAVTTGGGYDTDPVWSPDGSRLAWISMERDGYEADRMRLMVADILEDENAGETNGPVLKVSGIRELAAELDADASGIFWSQDGNEIYFNATVEALSAIFKVNVSGEKAQAVRITGKDHLYNFGQVFDVKEDENGTSILCTYQSMSFPTEIAEVRTSPEQAVTVSDISRENGHILEKIDGITQERVWLKSSNGDNLHCWVLYPPHFDPSKTYPAVEMLNGGPQTSLDQSWSYRWNFFLMAQSGYIVILPNRHGDSGFGQQWKEQISGDYCGVNMDDYLIAGRYIKDKPYVGKLAAIGASYGGYSAYMLEGLQDVLYDCIISHAGIFDEKMLWYTTEELWFANWDNGGLTEYAYIEGKTGPEGDGITFGGMQQAGAPYSKAEKACRHYCNSPESMVTRWRTPILCIHGMKDFRIPYEQGMAAFNAAQMMGVPSKLIIFPEETHWVLQPQNSLLWHKEVYSWLDKWLNDNE